MKPSKMRLFLAAAACAASLQASAQATPNANYTDMWWVGLAENGWGISFIQHPSNQSFAVLYHYDPLTPEGSTPDSADFKPLWVVMPGGTWTSPTRFTGPVYVTSGVPFFQSGSNPVTNEVGTFTFNFTDLNNGTFTYSIQGNNTPGSPAFGLPAANGVKNITRQIF